MKWLPTSAGPNQRAGLNEPPVSGPSDHDPQSKSAAGGERRPAPDLGVERDGEYRQHKDEGADALHQEALEGPAEQGTDLGRPVVGGAALVEQEGLGEQSAEDAARELGEDVDEPVDRVDPAEHDECRRSPPG